jgi:arsenical pump membrane protein
VSASHITAYVIALLTVAGILVRPWRVPEWAFAVGGALLLLLTGALDSPHAWRAALSGWEVYLFLVGVLTLAELARVHGVFAWLSAFILRAARGSRSRLFGIVFGVGVVVTATLSNDTTVILLTPAIVALLERIDAPPLPYLYACAFVANAASYALPVGNPANLVVYGAALPALLPWLAVFGISALVAIIVTFLSLRFALRRDLHGSFFVSRDDPRLSRAGRGALTAVGASACILIVGSAFGFSIGITAFICAVICMLGVTLVDRGTLRQVCTQVPWSIVPLVAGLFVVVAALDRAGALTATQHALRSVAALPSPGASLALAGATAIACNVFNNLPIALFAGAALRHTHLIPQLSRAVLVAIDLSPNLSLTGSLATLLWLIVVRREGIRVSPWHFFGLGAIVTIPSLPLAVLAIR